MEQAEHTAGGAPKQRAGDRLRSAREAQELSLDEVSVRTRVPKRLLEAIETGDHAMLPAPTYSAGFVKVYAQTVGLDPAELSQQFRNDLGRHATPRLHPEPFEPADPARVPSRLLATVALAVALLIAIGYGVWRSGSLWGYGADERARLAAGTETLPPVTTVTPTPVDPPAATAALSAPATPPATAASTTGPVVLTAKDTVWLRVYERGGETIFIGEMPPGDRFEVPATATDPLIRTSRPESLRITVGANEIPPLAAPSKLVSGASLKSDALLARLAPAGTDAPATVEPLVPLVPQTGNP
jgi:transcriptional regulator with XRE-family HTH domain